MFAPQIVCLHATKLNAETTDAVNRVENAKKAVPARAESVHWSVFPRAMDSSAVTMDAANSVENATPPMNA